MCPNTMETRFGGKYSKRRACIVGLGIKWTATIDFKAVLTCFKAVTTKNDTDSKLAKQHRSWYDIESYQAFDQVDSRSAADARAEKILDATTYHYGSR